MEKRDPLREVANTPSDNEPQPTEDTPKQPDVVPSTSEDKENGFSHKPQPETAKSDVGSDSHKPKLRLSFLKAFDPLYSESPEKVQTTSSSKPELREQAVTEESETFECEESAKLLNVSEDEGSFVDASANYDDANAGPISADKNVDVEEPLLKFYTPEKLQSAEQACDSEAVESTSEAVVSTSEAVVSTPEAVASTSTAVESTSKAAEKKPSFSHLAAIWASEAQKQPQPASGFTSDITESEIVRAISKKLSSHREVVQTRSKFTLTEVQFETYKTRRQRLLAETRARQGSGSDETSSSGSLNEVQRTSPERSCETRNEVSLASVARVDEPSESLSAEDDSSDSVELEFEEESSEESLKSEITVVIEQPRLVHSGSQYESEAAASSGRKETESQSKVGCHSTLEKICEAVEEPCVRKEAESQSEQNTEDVGSEVKPTFSTNERSSSPDRPASSDSSSSSDRLVRVKFRYMCLPDDNAIIEITNPSGSSSERSSDSSFFNFAAAEETYYQTAVEKYGKELAKNKSTASSLGEEKQADPRVEPELTKTEVSRSGSSEEEKEIQVGAKESGAEANKSELEAAAGSPEAEEQVGAVESTQIDALSQDKFEIKIESPQEEELKEPETETKLVEEISEPTTEVKLAEKEASINKSELVIESASLQEKEPEIKTYESKPEVEGGDAHIEEQGFKEEVELQPKETQKESGSSESESEPQSKLEPDITKEEASDQIESEPQKTESAVEEGTANTDLSVSDRKVEETDKNQISDQTKSEPQKTDSAAEETGNTGLSVSDTKVEDTDTDRNQISDQTESEPQKTDSTVEEGTTNTDLSVSDRKVEETDKNQISDRTESEPQKTDSTVEDTDADRKIEKTGESKEVLESEGLLKSDTFIKPEEEHHLDSGLDSIEESDTKTLKSTVSDSEGSAERELEVFREREDSCHLPVENLDHTENEPKIQTQWTETADEEQLTGKASRHEQAKLDEPNQPKAEEETVRSEVDEPAINLTDNQKSGIKTTDGDIYIAKMTDLSEKLSEQQQENSDLKLQLNAIQQAKASLELEIRQKEEVIIKTQAEALKNEQIFKQEIKLLREKLKENSKLIEKDGSKELEDQLKEAKAKEAKAVAELTQKIKDDLNYQKIMEEYENTIAARCADYQKLKEDHETATRHLANIELAFSDVHQKYERTKALLENFKANEEALNAALQACEKTCRQHEEKYESLKAHAKGQIEKSNKEILMLRDKYEMDINKLKAIIKRLEIKCSSLEVSFQQKTEECTALSALCEEVTGKKV